ncbi:MAG: glycoside hydrolase family 43 protein [Prevotella sp.]
MKRYLLMMAGALASLSLSVAQERLAWGDQRNGTYINPVLNADYSDPDVIRVDKRYYMVASDFNYMGIQVLESEDLVNWKLISQVYDHLDGYDDMGHYAKGSWAPAIMHHDGRFYVYFCTPDEGLFMSSATDARGPWEPLHCVKHIKGWEDPCPFWDEDGKAYLGHSKVGAGPIIIHRMSADGRELLDDGLTVYTGPVAEGTKFQKRDGWYYLVIPEGGVGTGWQTVLRSKNIYGPYEKKVVQEQGLTDINGPHQGNLVDTPEGEWWLFHFQETRELGRVVHLQPVQWVDGWPMAGTDRNMNGIGEPVYVYRNPGIPAKAKGSGGCVAPTSTAEGGVGDGLPFHSDEFDGDVPSYKGWRQDGLGLQWQWNHNPVHANWSLTERKGWLTLKALQADQLKTARNTLSQKLMGYEGEAVTQIDASGLAEGTCAGLCALGSMYVGTGMMRQDGKVYFYAEANGRRELLGTAGKTGYVKVHADGCRLQFYYSADGKSYREAGGSMEVRPANWKGPRLGLYCYSVASPGQGQACFNYFRYQILR